MAPGAPGNTSSRAAQPFASTNAVVGCRQECHWATTLADMALGDFQQHSQPQHRQYGFYTCSATCLLSSNRCTTVAPRLCHICAVTLATWPSALSGNISSCSVSQRGSSNLSTGPAALAPPLGASGAAPACARPVNPGAARCSAREACLHSVAICGKVVQQVGPKPLLTSLQLRDSCRMSVPCTAFGSRNCESRTWQTQTTAALHPDPNN
jgi:hypothetical protein